MKRLFTSLSCLFGLFLVNISLAQTAKEYVGTYSMDANDYVQEVMISESDGNLMIQAEGYDQAPIDKTNNADTYYLAAMDMDIRFTRDDAGKVSGIVLEGQGGQLTGVLAVTDKMTDASAAELKAPSMQDYAGIYDLEPNDYLEKLQFSINEKGELSLVGEGQDPSILAPDKDMDKFFTNVAGYDADIEFIRENGKVVKVSMAVAGGAVVFNGKKEINELVKDASSQETSAGSILDKYSGIYTMDPNGYIETLNFQVIDNVLTLVMEGQEPGILTADDSKENYFLSNLAGYDVEITFSGEGDAISSIEMVVGGGMAVFTGKK